MSRVALPTLVLAATLAASAAQASPFLLAMGTLGGTSDLSGLTGRLENGLPANILGGLGSGLAYAAGNTFLALPDRGPNATSYNSSVDDTVSYINRFQTVNLSLTRNTSGSGLAYKLSPTLTGTTLLYSPGALTYGSGTAYGLPSGAPAQNTSGKTYFTGRSDNYGTGTSGNPTDARFDPESIRLSNNGKSVFISDEIRPPRAPVRPQHGGAREEPLRCRPTSMSPTRSRPARPRSATTRRAAPPTRAWKASASHPTARRSSGSSRRR